jgi:hypothetical protein
LRRRSEVQLRTNLAGAGNRLAAGAFDDRLVAQIRDRQHRAGDDLSAPPAGGDRGLGLLRLALPVTDERVDHYQREGEEDCDKTDQKQFHAGAAVGQSSSPVATNRAL